jgi:hypothetical protein
MIQIGNFGVLIVGYARAENVIEIIDLAVSAGIRRIYVTLDAPKKDSEIQRQQESIEKKISEVNKINNDVQILSVRHSSNVGCSANLLAGIDWAFQFEKNLIILEDDCIPSLGFFEFVSSAHIYLVSEPSIWITSGTQVFPAITDKSAMLSKYPVTWGWATTRFKWREIKSALLFEESNLNSFNKPDMGLIERIYWKAGARRSYAGYADVWDIPLAVCFLRNEKFALLPSDSLVTNRGDDKYALNTNIKSSGIGIPTGKFHAIKSSPIRSYELELATRNYHYRIRNIFLITTFLHQVFDSIYFKITRTNRETLISRWKNASIIDHKL